MITVRIPVKDGKPLGDTHFASSTAAYDALLKQLYAHITQPEFTYTHRWTPGDLLMWDNIAVQHKATFDYDPLPRLLYRSTVRGPAIC